MPPGIKASVVIKNINGGLERLRREADLKNAHIKVGVFDEGKGGETRDGGLTNAELAAIHEYGTRNGIIPERSFIRSTIDEQRAYYFQKFLPALAEKFVKGQLSMDKLLNLFGLKVSTDIKNKVTQGEYIRPLLQQSTIDAKGSERPLVNTGRMVNSVTYATVIGDKEELK